MVGLARNARPLVVVALAVAMMLAVFLGLRVQTSLSEIQEQPTDNLNWNVTQIELDLVLLLEATRVASLSNDGDLSQVRKRFDLFYSRARNVTDGSGFAKSELADLAEPLAEALDHFISEVIPLVDADDQVLRSSLQTIEAEAVELRSQVRKSGIAMVARNAELSDLRRAEFGDLVSQMALSSAVGVAMLVLLLVLAVWLNRDAERAALETTRISARLASTVNSALDAIIVADKSGTIIQYNPSAQSIFGFSAEEAIGRRLGDLIVPKRMRAAHESGMERMQRTGEMRLVNSGRFQTEGLRKSGEEFPVEISISASKGDSGRIFIAYLRDISDRIAAEAALTRARDEALAADRAKTNFIAVMSHEMRTPLNGVLASLEIAQRMATDPKQKHFIELARDSGAQLLRHANDVLDISRMDSGALKVTEEDFDLKALIGGLAAAQAPVCAEKGLKMEFTALDDIPPLRGDPFRIGQIIQNFLSNAIKFTAEGGISVELEQQEQVGDVRVVEIRVIDSGPGIPEADQDRIFKDFVMLDPSFGRSVGGAGLGLAISRRLAQAMGGDVGVESEVGEGSVFWLRLPLAVSTHQADRIAEHVDRIATPRLDVLVVEDNAINRAVLEEMLAHLGHNVTMATDGQEGLGLARARRFDVILMDISMPQMDGITATRHIRSKGASQHSRIVAVTAHSMPSDIERFRTAGMDGTLLKPISSESLQKVLAGLEAADQAPSDAVLDPERLADLRKALGEEGLARIVRRFCEDGEQMVARIAGAVEDGVEGDALHALCHEAAGVMAVLGAVRLRTHLSHAENLCREGALDEARRLLRDRTAPLWQQTRDAVIGLVNRA